MFAVATEFFSTTHVASQENFEYKSGPEGVPCALCRPPLVRDFHCQTSLAWQSRDERASRHGSCTLGAPTPRNSSEHLLALHPPFLLTLMRGSPRDEVDEHPLLPVDERAPQRGRHSFNRKSASLPFCCNLKNRPAIMALLGVITFAYVLYASAFHFVVVESTAVPNASQGFRASARVPALGVPTGIQQSWSMYSPYFPAGSYISPPEGCEIDQVRTSQSFETSYSLHAEELARAERMTRVPCIRPGR